MDAQLAAQVIGKDFSMCSNRGQLISAPIANRQLLAVESSHACDEEGKRTWVRKAHTTWMLLVSERTRDADDAKYLRIGTLACSFGTLILVHKLNVSKFLRLENSFCVQNHSQQETS